MEHGEHSTPGAKRFGVNTNGLGILIVTIVAVCLALFCWNFWKDGSREKDLYRLNSLPTQPTGHDHEQGEKPGETPSSAASATVAPSTTETASQKDTLSKQVVADTAKQAIADSSKEHKSH